MKFKWVMEQTLISNCFIPIGSLKKFKGFCTIALSSQCFKYNECFGLFWYKIYLLSHILYLFLSLWLWSARIHRDTISNVYWTNIKCIGVAVGSVFIFSLILFPVQHTHSVCKTIKLNTHFTFDAVKSPDGSSHFKLMFLSSGAQMLPRKTFEIFYLQKNKQHVCRTHVARHHVWYFEWNGQTD